MTENLDYVAFVNGVIQTVVGHPLDSLKTWKQSNLKVLLSVKSIYRGVSYPLLTNSILNHVQFNLMDNKKNSFYLNSFYTSLFSGLFLSPIEYFKIRKQNNLKISFPTGTGITILREIPGVMIYFGVLRNFKKFTNIDSDLITGGIAGSLSWIVTYPIDTIKTRLQADVPFRKALLRPYYNGLGYCLARAFLANSLGYYSYVKLNKILKNVY